MRRVRIFLLLLTAIVAAGACSGGSGNDDDGGDDDDDDDVATTPPPGPDGVDYCYVIWGATGGGVVTEYYLDFPVEAWTTAGAPVAIDDVDNWAELTQYDAGGTVIFSAVATAGQVTLVQVGGFDESDTVSVDDDDAQLLADLARGVTATAGAGTFTGVWSALDTPLFSTSGKTLGSGTLSIAAVSGTASVPAIVGDAYSFAQCYDLQAVTGRRVARRGGRP